MKIVRTTLFALCVTLFAACGNYTEEFTIQANGSGSYTLYTDVVEGSIEMGANMAVMFSDEDLTEEQLDSLKLTVADKIWEDFPNKIDSTIDMVSEMPDSFLNYGNNRHYAERMIMYMRGGREKGYVNTGFEFDFKDSEDFQSFSEYFEKFQNSSGSDSENSTMLSSLSNTKSDATYDFSSKSFKRTVTYTFPEDEEGDPSMDKMLAMMGEGGKYITIVNTEREIKKVKGDYIKSQEKNKVVFEYPFKESLEGSINTDFEIIFK